MTSREERMLQILEESELAYEETIGILHYSEGITISIISVLESGLVPPEEAEGLIQTGRNILRSFVSIMEFFEHGKEHMAIIREPDKLNTITIIDKFLIAEKSALSDISEQLELTSYINTWFDESCCVIDRWSRHETNESLSLHSRFNSLDCKLKHDIVYAMQATEAVVSAMIEWRDYLDPIVPECPPHRNFL